MVLVEFTTFDTLNDLLRIHMVLFVYYLHYSLFNHQAFAVEVHEVRLWWLVSQAEFTCPQLPQSQAILRVDEDLWEKFLCLSRKDSLLLVLARYNSHLFIIWSLSFKGQLSSKHRIERDPQAPNINQLRIITMPLDDLRRRVRRRPTNSPSKLSEVSSAAKAKIYKFHIPILIEHDILRFDIPMAEPALLKI